MSLSDIANAIKAKAAQASQLISSAVNNGNISTDAASAIIQDENILEKIAAQWGVPASDLFGKRFFLITLLLDDSGSMDGSKIASARDSANSIMQALRDAADARYVLVAVDSLNGSIQRPYTLLTDMQPIGNEYRIVGDTPLYDKFVECCTLGLTKLEELTSAGYQARHLIVPITDGDEAGSETHTLEDASAIRKSFEEHASQSLVMYMAIGDGEQTAIDLGIKPERILNPSTDPREIRKAAELVSQLAVRMSQKINAGGQPASIV